MLGSWGNDCRSGVRGGGRREEWGRWSCSWGNDCRSGVRGGGRREEWGRWSC
nr:hypothetical protein [Tanacetum cinerariifolium]